MGTSLVLRIGMVLIGLALLFALYYFGTRRSKSNRRFKKDGRLRQINPVDIVSEKSKPNRDSVLLDGNVDVSGETGLLEHEFGTPRIDKSSIPDLSLSDIDPRADGDIGELPRIQKSPKRAAAKKKKLNKKQVSQIEMSFDDEQNTSPEVEELDTERLLTLYVLPSGNDPFVGEFVIQALNGVGLQFGDMDIFHHFGAGKLKTEQPLFSVANMVEPGSFDLKRIERFSTVGLVFFLQLPASLDGAVSFELFLNTAQRLTESLAGVLYADPKTPLDSPRIEEMRKVAAEY